jgi:uncharacterized protein YndB with AHSA1/START domain
MRQIHHVVDVDATSEKVWWALTDAGGLTGWWSTKLETTTAAVGVQLVWTLMEGFNPVMEITRLEEPSALDWTCVGGHDPWQLATFRFELATLDDRHTRLRFWQDYAVELDDDAYGTYNFLWGFYLESLRLLCTTGTGKPHPAE